MEIKWIMIFDMLGREKTFKTPQNVENDKHLG